jgi:peptidoglycan hydrolase-like protein with peptidoglycan-binding domain
MKSLTAAAMALALSSAVATSVFAQYPGEPAQPDRSWDPVRDMNFQRQWGMPDETVRQAQQVLRDQGYYDGPIDGIVKNPAYLKAIWKFQKAKGLPTTTHLDAPTLAALNLSAPGLASPGLTGPSNFGAR